MATGVYIDGFNVYYGAVRGTPHRWLDMEALCRRLLPQDDLACIRYFTAKVSARPNDPDAPVRQATYIRALETSPLIQVHFGSFLSSTTRMPLANPQPHRPGTVEVIKTEEKGSDVNLASHLLLDVFRARCDTVVIISNDSDLKEPLRIARYELGVKVGVINPHPARKRSRTLSADAHFFKQIRPNVLASCQFAPVMQDAAGQFRKPASW
jgi:uncharacterized LabA/DUF88 family protein